MLDVSAQQKDVAHMIRAELGTIKKCWAAVKSVCQPRSGNRRSALVLE